MTASLLTEFEWSWDGDVLEVAMSPEALVLYGPVVPVVWRNPLNSAESRGHALLDTGAQMSCIAPTSLAAVGAVPTGTVTSAGAHIRSSSGVFDLSLGLDFEGVIPRLGSYSELGHQPGKSFGGETGPWGDWTGIVGRDFLSTVGFELNGATGRYALRLRTKISEAT